jgi:hypothetical protein
MSELTNEEILILESILKRKYKEQLITKQNSIYADKINKILLKFNINKKIDYSDLIYFPIGNKKTLILNHLKDDEPKKLTRIIEEKFWEIVEEEVVLYHFTTEDSARNICESNILRLYNITKNTKDGEIIDFLKEFELNNIEDNYKRLFYASFTKKIPLLRDKRTIKNFRKFTGYSGARLKFIVKKKTINFKDIDYKKNIKKILKELFDVFKNEFDITLTINGFSTKFASFYVNEIYSYENESRLFINTLFEEDYEICNDEVKKCTYIELNLKDNIYLSLEEIKYEAKEEIFQ